MTKRRNVILGMGALAFGSGALSANAAFQNSVTPDGDMRVIVDEELVVEAGAAFRDGSGNYQSTVNNPKFNGTDNKDFFNVDNSSLSQGQDDGGLGGDLDKSQLPAAHVNDQTNDDLIIKTAVPLGNSPNQWTFPDLLQVRNESTSKVHVGIKYDLFGVDTTNGDGGTQGSYGGNVSEGYVPQDPTTDDVGVYSFVAGSSADDTAVSNKQISTVDGQTQSWSNVSEQDIHKDMKIDAGNTRQVSLQIDLGQSSIRTEIENASQTPNAWGTGQDSVQLVQRLAVGTQADNDSSGTV